MPFTRLNNVEQFWRGGRDGWNTFIRQLREKRYSLKIQFDSTIYTIKEESNKEVEKGDKGEEEEKDDKKGMKEEESDKEEEEEHKKRVFSAFHFFHRFISPSFSK